MIVALSLQTQRLARSEDSLGAGSKLKGTRSKERKMLTFTQGWHLPSAENTKSLF